jgi:glutathione S-transferase
MLLIGVNRSPYTRRVAITLTAYGVAYEQKCVSGFGEREEVRAANPLGRIPALLLDNGETLVDSGAIIDHLDELYGGDRPLTPALGADRRAVLKVAAIMMGACDKALQAAYHRNHTPVEKRHQPWVDDCTTQVANALAAIDAAVRWSAACRLKGDARPHATYFYGGPWRNRGLFRALAHAIQVHFGNKQSPYPVERTLLATGALAAAMQSRHAGGESQATPHLEFGYAAVDWRSVREMGRTWEIITPDTPEPKGLKKDPPG